MSRPNDKFINLQKIESKVSSSNYIHSDKTIYPQSNARISLKQRYLNVKQLSLNLLIFE